MSDWHAYVAGFFDGEGSVSIARVRVGERSDYHKIVVVIGQRAKYREVLDRIHDEFGGTVGLRNQKTRIAERWAEHAVWQLQDKTSIEVFLRAMQPYCIVKARQIEIGLDFIRTFEQAPNVRDSLGRIRGRQLTADEVERRESIRLQLREANALGPARAKPSTLPPLDVQHLARETPLANVTTVSRGEHRYNSKLTDDDVRSIRTEFAAGGITKRSLAQRHGVTDMVINGIVRRTRWGHVEDIPPSS